MDLYIYKNNQNNGPFDESTVERELRSGNFAANDLACYAGMKDWRPLSDFFPHALGTAPSPNIGFKCPFCQSTRPPLIRQKISTAGWVWFIILFGSCIGTFICWIGLLMKDDYRVCGSCGITLG